MKALKTESGNYLVEVSSLTEYYFFISPNGEILKETYADEYKYLESIIDEIDLPESVALCHVHNAIQDKECTCGQLIDMTSDLAFDILKKFIGDNFYPSADESCRNDEIIIHKCEKDVNVLIWIQDTGGMVCHYDRHVRVKGKKYNVIFRGYAESGYYTNPYKGRKREIFGGFNCLDFNYNGTYGHINDMTIDVSIYERINN